MFQRTKFRWLMSTALLLAVAFSSANAQDKDKKKKEIPADGIPVLWQEPTDIASRDLYLGPGGAEMKPDLSKVTLIEKEKGGYSTKYRVRDGAGREWVAKIGKEAQPEAAAVRLMWALGYVGEINYLVPRVRIEGLDKTFENVRFEARKNGVKRLDEWQWESNPFIGRPEFQGLKVMMALLNNWDVKDSNNKILLVHDEQTGNNELRYIISDLGATFGKSSGSPFWSITRSRNNPHDFAQASFVDGVKNGHVHFRYSGKRNQLFDDITTANAQWIGDLLSRLSESQIRDAFRAANYTPDQIDMLTTAVQSRIKELNALAGDTPTAQRDQL